MTGKLYGIGVGPGDPELITLKAKRILEEVSYVAVPKAAPNKRSFALTIAKDFLKNKKIMELVFPMSHDEKVLESSWDNAITNLKKVLDKGEDIAFITLGDPTVYSTYMYVHKTIRSLGYDTEIIPGITSFCASAAKVGMSIAENKETIAVIPSASDCEGLEELLDSFDNIVLMKVSGNFRGIKEILERKGLVNRTILVSNCGTEDESVERDIKRIKGDKLSYFTTMIVKRNGVN